MQILNHDYDVATFIVGSGGVTAGDLVVISSGKVVKAAAAATDATIVGIAEATAAADATVQVGLTAGKLIESTYTGSTKTVVAAADRGAVFDVSNEKTVNLDDTTGGFCVCQGFNNTTKTIKFRIPRAKHYL